MKGKEINHPQQTDHECQRDLYVKEKEDKIKTFPVPSRGSRQNSLTETLNDDYDQRSTRIYIFDGRLLHATRNKVSSCLMNVDSWLFYK